MQADGYNLAQFWDPSWFAVSLCSYTNQKKKGSNQFGKNVSTRNACTRRTFSMRGRLLHAYSSTTKSCQPYPCSRLARQNKKIFKTLLSQTEKSLADGRKIYYSNKNNSFTTDRTRRTQCRTIRQKKWQIIAWLTESGPDKGAVCYFKSIRQTQRGANHWNANLPEPLLFSNRSLDRFSCVRECVFVVYLCFVSARRRYQLAPKVPIVYECFLTSYFVRPIFGPTRSWLNELNYMANYRVSCIKALLVTTYTCGSPSH